MKLNDFFKEEFADTVRFNNNTYDIFVNPTMKEIKDAKKIGLAVRYFVDLDDKKVYVFHEQLVHSKAIETLKKTDHNIITGVADIKDGKLISIHDPWELRILTDFVHGLLKKEERKDYLIKAITGAKRLKNILTSDLTWIDRYIKNFSIDVIEHFRKLNSELINGELDDILNKKISESYSFKELLREEFVTADENFEIFVNPSPKEIRDAADGKREIRFIADNKNHKLYVFNVNLLHGIALGKIMRKDYGHHMIRGTAIIANGKWSMDSSDFIEGLMYLTKGNDEAADKLKEILSFDTKWADKYIQISDYMNRVRKKLEEN